jgi:anti-sigma B factor antagonist
MLDGDTDQVGAALEARITAARVGSRARLVVLGGEIDLHTAPRLDDELRAAHAARDTRVIVDLSAATFVDSTVLGVLLEARQRLEERGGSLVLVCHDRRILRTLEVAGLDRVFTLEATLAEAMAALHDRRP